MKEVTSTENLSVALLLDDLNEVKAISTVFKKLGIIPHFYEDLKTFWNGVNDRTPALCIVDVKKMSEGELTLHAHPLAQTEKLPVVFYYTQNTEPLLVSTYDFFHLGLLKKHESYPAAVNSILKRLHHLRSLEKENSHLKNNLFSLNQKNEKLELEKRINENTDQYQSMVKSVCVQLEEMRGENDFFRATEKVFQGIDEITEFALLELSFNGQKLISPLSHVQKFRAIPSIWLGQACLRGIELFAQNMATQVAIEIMGGDLVSLFIKGHHSRPDKILFIKAKNELFYNNFDWNMLEAYLNGFYASFQIKLNKETAPEKKIGSTFEAMSFLDQFLFGKISGLDEREGALSDVRLINVDLTPLVDAILKKGSNRFFWNKFEKEFCNKLEIQSRIDFKLFHYGVNHIAFIVPARDLDMFFDELKDFSSKFAYWKYFEDSDGILSQTIKPKVTMVPLSAFAYLKAAQAPIHLAEKNRDEKDADKMLLGQIKSRRDIWGIKEPINEI